MKRFLSLAAAAVMASAFAAKAADFQPGIIYDLGGKFDKSFNEGVYNGAEEFKKEFNVDYRGFEIANDSQREQAMRNFARRGVDPILAVGFSQAAAVEKVAKEFPKVRTAERPEELRGDFVSMNKIIGHDISQVPADIYLQTHSTNPLLRSDTISEALRKFAQSDGYDSLFSVNRFQTRLYSADGTPINHDPADLIRTQDLEPVFEENSCLYVFTAESFAAAGGRRIGVRPMMYETDRIESIAIDDEFTFGLAELLSRYAHEKGPRP